MRTGYRMAEDGTSIEIEQGTRTFNRGIRRGNTILVTGDKPRFALLRTNRSDTMSPDFHKWGEGRLLIHGKDGRSARLDEFASIRTVFFPHGTLYELSDPAWGDCKWTLLVAQAGDWGSVAKLGRLSSSYLELAGIDRIEFEFGGLGVHGRTHSAPYFPEDNEDASDDTVVLKGGRVVFADKQVEGQSAAVASIGGNAAVEQGKAVFHFAVADIGEEGVFLVVGAENSVPVVVDNGYGERLISEGESYYAEVLSACTIRTPSSVIDSGFRTALLNLDYSYSDPAWLEGVHWWASYWANNYQISAAIGIGQLDRVKRALTFFGLGERGPSPLIMASGKPLERCEHDDEDGLPYFIWQFLQYVDATGDLAFAESVWEPLMRALDKLWEARDFDGNGLIGWHIFCNSFMYQADHLGMPGEGASPSLMFVGLTERLARLGERIGRIPDAQRWRHISVKMREGLEERLWNKREGVFYNHIDLQGVKHMAHYYTDLVFPTLYSGLPEWYGWSSLEYCNRNLWICDELNNPSLMRVGNLMPPLFGNNNVMPAQLSEAARAYARIGDRRRTYRLLEATALAGTVFTDAPGNFPERMGDDGSGIYNYIFGNPIGSYIYAVISGLFGVTIDEEGEALVWTPCYPVEWPEAELKTNYADIAYSATTNEDGTVTRTYRVTHVGGARSLRLIDHVPGTVSRVTSDDSDLRYFLCPSLESVRLETELSAGKSHEIRVVYRPESFLMDGTTSVSTGGAVSWIIPEGQSVTDTLDPQEAVEELRAKDNVLAGLTSEYTGDKTLFVLLEPAGQYVPLRFQVQEPLEVAGLSAIQQTNGKVKLRFEWRVAKGASWPSDAEWLVRWQGESRPVCFDSSPGLHQAEVSFSNREFFPEGLYAADVELWASGQLLWSASQEAILKGVDAETSRRMAELRDRQTVYLDLTPMRNAPHLWAMSLWRVWKEYPVPLSSLAGEPGIVRTEAGSFQVLESGENLAIIENGRSERYSRQTMPSPHPSSLEIAVGRRVRMVSLFYANEAEARHTATTVGSITLQYDDGCQTIIPLAIGKQLDMLYDKTAESALPIAYGEWDYLNVWRLSARSDSALSRFTIQLDVPDVQLGLLGASVVAIGEETQ
ncbi:glycoside hydrolase family 116 protein [Cohnella silvisoli]|uniref:Glycoside hydrolase family 116 protein n=1 Tax=Cohnella silvisoli TaxID=2873699 RepID=A0ABV1KW51_9BACL|nr:glycoside hydrolase family 116 protein [Cohnella silvisoli]MCD9023739.1 glycoside hydrolase family 116 protein [Cohnella silvisoli]